MATEKLWTVIRTKNGAHSEDYIFMAGRLIMKRWYINGQHLYSRMFHESEGLTQFSPEVRALNAAMYTRFMSMPSRIRE